MPQLHTLEQVILKGVFKEGFIAHLFQEGYFNEAEFMLNYFNVSLCFARRAGGGPDAFSRCAGPQGEDH